MDKKYVSRYIPVSAEKLDIIQAHQQKLEATLGFKVSLSDAIVHAIKKLNETEDKP
jgi:hypothetical protein